MSHSQLARSAMMMLFNEKLYWDQPDFDPVFQDDLLLSSLDNGEDMSQSSGDASVDEEQPLDHDETMNGGTNITPEASSFPWDMFTGPHGATVYLQHARQQFLLRYTLNHPHSENVVMQNPVNPRITHVHIMNKLQQTAKEFEELQHKITAASVSEQQAGQADLRKSTHSVDKEGGKP